MADDQHVDDSTDLDFIGHQESGFGSKDLCCSEKQLHDAWVAADAASIAVNPPSA